MEGLLVVIGKLDDIGYQLHIDNNGFEIRIAVFEINWFDEQEDVAAVQAFPAHKLDQVVPWLDTVLNTLKGNLT
jgi:hypothetical protein